MSLNQTASSTVSFQPNTLAETLSMRYPIVWLNTIDTVEVIQQIRSHIELYPELSFYIFNALSGLQKYNFNFARFDTVLVQDFNPITREDVQRPIFKISEALEYLQDDSKATLFVANAEQFENDLNDIYTYLSFAWRNSWKNNTMSGMPLQLLLSSTVMPSPPKAVSSFVPIINFTFPTKTELINLVTFISEETKTTLDIPAVASASRGLAIFEAIQLYHSMIARSNSIDPKVLEDLTFERMANRIGIDIRRPQVHLDNIAGGENLKKILETSLWIKNNPSEAISLGHKKSLHRFLLLGIPGTGKSMLCEGASNYLNLNLIRTGVSQQLSKWHGESENNMRALFEQINALDPVCVWCDEFGRDVQGGQSSHLVDGGSTARMHGIFLTGLQELPSNTYFFAAANDISTLPPEMLRADRFDKIFFVGFPTFDQRMKIFQDALESVDHSIKIEKVAVSTGGFTGAELINALSHASSYSISEMRQTDTADVMRALKGMRDRLWSRSRSYIIGEYKAAYDRYEWASDDQYNEASDYINGNVPRSIQKTSIPQSSTPPVIIKASIT